MRCLLCDAVDIGARCSDDYQKRLYQALRLVDPHNSGTVPYYLFEGEVLSLDQHSCLHTVQA